MSGKNHIAFALFTSTAISFACYTPEIPAMAHPYLFIAGSVLGAALVDFDSPNSIISKMLPFISKLVCLTGDHRGTFLHDVFFTMVASVLLYLFAPACVGIGFGMWTHLLLDAMTIRGVLFLGKRVHILPGFLRFKSLSATATVVNVFFILLIAYGMVSNFGELMLFNFVRSFPFT